MNETHKRLLAGIKESLNTELKVFPVETLQILKRWTTEQCPPWSIDEKEEEEYITKMKELFDKAISDRNVNI